MWFGLIESYLRAAAMGTLRFTVTSTYRGGGGDKHLLTGGRDENRRIPQTTQPQKKLVKREGVVETHKKPPPHPLYNGGVKPSGIESRAASTGKP